MSRFAAVGSALPSATLLSALLAAALLVAACSPEGSPSDFVSPAQFEGDVLTEEVAVRLFACLSVRKTPRHRYDPQSYIALLPDADHTHPWPEHPRRKLRLKTNNRGYREDQPTLVEKRGPRILVTGDSHTEGFVWNRESFVNVLEHSLRAASKQATGTERPYDVINAGIGASHPYNHIGVLRNALELQPDAFIAVLFSGNDFGGVTGVADFFNKRERPTFPESYREVLTAAVDSIGSDNDRWGRTIIGNGYNQPYRLKHFPAEIELTFSAVMECYDEMASICAERQIPFMVVLLPSKPHVDVDDDRELHRTLLEKLQLTEEQFGASLALARRVMAALDEQGVRTFDATPGLAARSRPDRPLYWLKDYHLNVAGHAALAELLEPHVAEMLGE